MRILLLRLDRIGDFVLGVPAYRALRKAYPGDSITVVVPSDVAEMAKACPYFDEVYVFDALWLLPGQRPFHRWRSAWKLVRFLRNGRFDLVLNFRHQNRMDPWVTGLSGAVQRVGFSQGPWSFFLTKKAPPPPPKTHQVDRNLGLLAALGIQAADDSLEFWTDEHDRKTAEAHLPAQEILPGVPRIAVHLGAATPSKRWREDDFTILLDELYATFQAQIVVLGGEHDLGFAHEVLDGMECPLVNLVGKLSLRQMAVVVRKCRLFIGCDSGPTHIAAACGVPVVCLFSAANEAEVWRPRGPQVRVLTRNPPCSPCRSHDCLRTDGYFCMADIRVEDVMREVKGLLNEPLPKN